MNKTLGMIFAYIFAVLILFGILFGGVMWKANVQKNKYTYIKTVNGIDLYYNNETNRMYCIEDNKYKELWIIDENEIRPAYYPND